MSVEQRRVRLGTGGELLGITPLHMAVLSGSSGELLDRLELTEEAGSVGAELEQAGVIDKTGTVYPTVAEPIRWISQARCAVSLEIAGDAASHQHYLWGADDGIAALVEYKTGEHRLLRHSPTFLPNLLARLLRLGPRPEWSLPDPSKETSLPLGDPEVIDLLLAAEPEVRNSGIRAIADMTGTWGQKWVDSLIGSPGWRASRLTLIGGYGAHADLSRSNVVSLIDTPRGICIVTTDDGSAEVWPVSPSGVWSVVISLMTGTEPDGENT